MARFEVVFLFLLFVAWVAGKGIGGTCAYCNLLYKPILLNFELYPNFVILFTSFRNWRDCNLWRRQHDGGLGEGDISVLKCKPTTLAWPLVQSYRECDAHVSEHWFEWLLDNIRGNWELANFYEWDWRRNCTNSECCHPGPWFWSAVQL